MKRINLYICILALITAFNSGCSDFLEENPKSSINEETYYKTVDDAIAATNAIYDYLVAGLSNGLWDNNFGGLFFNDFWEYPELMSDNVFTKQSSVDYLSVSNFGINAYNSRIETLWRDFYQTIGACNIVIKKVPGIEFTDEVLKNQLIAEAKFFRGLCYFELTRFWGDVP